MSRRRRLTLALALATTLACAKPPEPLPPTELPLASLASSARLVVETDALDIGEPAARPALWSGWGPDERNSEMSFVWGAGASSRILLDVVEPREREMRLRGWSYPFGSDPPQQVTFLLNGREVASRALGPAPGGVRLELRKSLWQAGQNELELRYSRVHAVAEEPPWAAAWDGFRLEDARPDGAPPPRLDDAGRLVLPARTAIEWTLELPGGAWIAWDEMSAAGGAELQIAVRGGESAAESVVDLDGGRGRLTPVGAARQPVTVALRALGDAGEIRLSRARLHLPESALGERRPAAAAAPVAPPVAPAPNLVIYLIDTLRADHLGAYGYPRPTSPEIDRFAAESVRWIEARAQASWTRPAVATILTGLLPVTHGVEQVFDALPEEIETVAERLRAGGYTTALFTTNANIVPRLGFAQGWDHYAYLVRQVGRRTAHLESQEMNPAIFDWLARGRDRSKPFFAVVHTLDPHDAYLPAERFRLRLAPDVPVERGCCESLREMWQLEGDAALARAAELRQLYDAEIAQNDASFGDLLRELDRLGVGGDTAVLLLSDHGEEFYDHGSWKHGWTLYEEMLRIPFVLRLPGRAHAGRVLPGPVDQIDVVPTLLELARLPVPAELPGASVLAELGGAPRQPRVSLAWLKRGEVGLASATLQQWKLVRRLGGWIAPSGQPPFELFGLASDPRERHDLALGGRVRRDWLIAQLKSAEARYASGTAAETVELDAELEQALRALGYL